MGFSSYIRSICGFLGNYSLSSDFGSLERIGKAFHRHILPSAVPLANKDMWIDSFEPSFQGCIGKEMGVDQSKAVMEEAKL
jgi:hypothetical protein